MPLWLKLECPQAVPGRKELGLERGRRLLVGGGHSFGTQGLEGGKCPSARLWHNSCLGTWYWRGSASKGSSWRCRGLYTCVCVIYSWRFKSQGDLLCSSPCISLPTTFTPSEESQKRQWERFIQWSAVYSVSFLLTALLQAEESSSLFSRCTEELHCQTLQARPIGALGCGWTRCF